MSTFSVVCGTPACNANCPFCISKMTTAAQDQKLPEVDFDWTRFKRAIKYVRTKEQQLNTALITGRGEPTLYPQHLYQLVDALGEHFLVELQTNGARMDEWESEELQGLWLSGATTIALSICSMNARANNEIMRLPASYNFPSLIRKLKEDRFTVRLTYLLTDQDIEDVKDRDQDWFWDTIQYAKILGAHQITFRGVGLPTEDKNPDVYNWAKNHGDIFDYSHHFEAIGTELWRMSWGGRIFDVDGMSVCYADCLTDTKDLDQPRSYIFDGKHLLYSWQYKGALIF